MESRRDLAGALEDHNDLNRAARAVAKGHVRGVSRFEPTVHGL
jgi:hypothetical protein